MKNNFKYTAKFPISLAAAKEFSDELELDENGLKVSKASIQDISPMFPSSVKLEENLDLIGVFYDAAVVNHFNRNGQGIATDTAIAIKDLCIHKPNNLEHDSKVIVGHVVGSTFTEHGQGGEVLSNDDVYGTLDEFDISLSSVVYGTVDPEFSEILVESSRSGSNIHNEISASWELGYNDYVIAMGPTEYLKDCVIIEDEAEIKKLSKFLKNNGGSGIDEEGNLIHQLIIGDALPVGFAYTVNPAANVKGVKSEFHNNKEENLEQSAASISQIENSAVNKTKSDINMKKEQYVSQEVMDKLQSLEAMMKDSVVAKASGDETVSQTISAAIKDVNDCYVSDLKKKEEAIANFEKASKESASKIEGLEKQITETNEKLEVFEAAQAEQVALATFNERMEKFDEEFSLPEDVASIVCKKIKSCDSSESFENYFEESKVIFASFSKEAIAAAEEQKKVAEADMVKKELAKASKEEVKVEVDETAIAASLESAKAEDAAVSTASEEEPSMEDKWKKAFSDDGVEFSV